MSGIVKGKINEGFTFFDKRLFSVDNSVLGVLTKEWQDGRAEFSNPGN